MTNVYGGLSREEFLARRRSGIGGSDAGAIIGLNPFRTALDVYREKVGEVADDAPTAAQLRGRYLEDVAAELYCNQTGRRVRRQPQRAHSQYPFIVGNIDRQVLAATLDEVGEGHEVTPLSTGLLEVKCPGIRTFLRYQREGLPAYIVCQAQHYLGIYGYDWVGFAIFNADLWKLIHFEIPRDDVFIAGLISAEQRFWHDYVEKKVPPPEVGILHSAIPALDLPIVDRGSLVVRDDKPFLDAVETFKQARELREMAEGVEEQAKVKLQELMGTYGVAEGGDLRIYWQERPGRKSFDRKALEAARPLDRDRVFALLSTLADEPGIGLLLERLKDGWDECNLDFTKFDKVGKPYPEFRPFFLKPVGQEDE